MGPTKRTYTPPAVRRVDLVAHEVALQVCKTSVTRVQANGARARCNQGGANACKSLMSPS